MKTSIFKYHTPWQEHENEKQYLRLRSKLDSIKNRQYSSMRKDQPPVTISF